MTHSINQLLYSVRAEWTDEFFWNEAEKFLKTSVAVVWAIVGLTAATVLSSYGSSPQAVSPASPLQSHIAWSPQ